MIQETTENMEEVQTSEVNSAEPISMSTEPPKRDKTDAEPVRAEDIGRHDGISIHLYNLFHMLWKLLYYLNITTS